MGRKERNWISRDRAFPNKEVAGGEERDGMGWGGQKMHNSSLDDGVAESSRTLTKAMLAILGSGRRVDEGIPGITNHHAQSAHNQREPAGTELQQGRVQP